MSKSSIWSIVQVQLLWVRSVWSFEKRQWRGSPHSPNLQGWRRIIKLFKVINGTLAVEGVLSHCRDAVGVFYSPCPQGLSQHLSDLWRFAMLFGWLVSLWQGYTLKNYITLKSVILLDLILISSNYFSVIIVSSNYFQTDDLYGF